MKTDEFMNEFGMIRDKYIADAHDEPPKNTHGKCIIALIVVFAILAALAAPIVATAADSDRAYDMLYSFTPTLAQRLKPIRRSCEDNGIRLEVLNTELKGNTIYAYFSATDLDGDKFKDHVVPFFSHAVNTVFDSASVCSFDSYNEDLHRLCFSAQINSLNDDPVTQGKATLTVSKFLVGVEQDRYIVDCDIPSLYREGETMRLGRDYAYDPLKEEPDGTVCADETGMIFDPGKGVSIVSSCCYDGKLHIKTRYDDHVRTGNRGLLSFQNSEGVSIDCAQEITYDDLELGCRYVEYLYDETPEQLEGYELILDTITSDALIEGNWRVTFSLE